MVFPVIMSNYRPGEASVEGKLLLVLLPNTVTGLSAWVENTIELRQDLIGIDRLDIKSVAAVFKSV